MPVPSSLLPDWTYPVQPANAETAARLGARVVGTLRRHRGGGRAMFLGFRARDDQSGATGENLRVLFDALSALGAYAGEDHPERISRGGPVLANKFPNGAVTVTSHFRAVRECWPGHFKRDPEQDAPIVARLDLPPNELDLADLALDGHVVRYRGAETLTYAVKRGRLTAFCGHEATGITVDGTSYRFTDRPVTLAWGIVAGKDLAPGVRAALRLWVSEPAEVRLPVEARRAALANGTRAGARVAVRREDGATVVRVAAGQENRWIYVGDW